MIEGEAVMVKFQAARNEIFETRYTPYAAFIIPQV